MEIENWGTPKLRGRGMVKWLPFASMPEQHETICDMNHKFSETASLWFFLFAVNLCFL
ncbi:hypothetical protein BTGOE6_57930 [Bacillus wiedmannii]|nr:hypothetical protein BTGOE6_57930 [Bacillus wiedmannii]